MDATLGSATYSATAPAVVEKRDAIGVHAASFGLALALTSLFNAALVVVKELNENTLLAWMKTATGHHWVTQGVLDIALFVVLGFALTGVAQRLRDRPAAILGLIVGGMAIGSFVIAGFYCFD